MTDLKHCSSRLAGLVLIGVLLAFSAPGLTKQGVITGQDDIESACGRCHGKSGITDNSNMPNLAGQNKGYLVNQLENFRSGFRRSSVMGPIAKTLDDDAIEKIAEYYSRSTARP